VSGTTVEIKTQTLPPTAQLLQISLHNPLKQIVANFPCWSSFAAVAFLVLYF
jgi:hypothetical protein